MRAPRVHYKAASTGFAHGREPWALIEGTPYPLAQLRNSDLSLTRSQTCQRTGRHRNAHAAVRRGCVRAFTPPSQVRHAKLIPMNGGIIELRQKGASLRLIR
jgi:hypothetical protein